MNDRNAIAQFRLLIWKLVGLRKRVVIGRYALYKKGENESHILLKCKEIKIWGEQFLHKKGRK
jgi:hypothetical protein